MSFIGYCTLKELVSFLDIGEWIVNDTVIAAYQTGDVIKLTTTNANAVNTHIIRGTVKMYINNILIDEDDYVIDYDTGVVTFDTTPTADDFISATYYISSAYDSDDLEYYLTLGATEVEYDTRQIFREIAVDNYRYYVEDGLDYTKLVSAKYIELPYAPILEVAELTVDGTAITNYMVKDNKIFLVYNSERTEFTSQNEILISFSYGIPEDEDDQTDEHRRLLKIASEANKIATAMIMAESPLGRNTFIDNSKVTQMSKGDVRPELFNENQLRDLKLRYDTYINKLRAMSTKLL